ncbi:MAG: hypothetical protein IJ833_03700 [Lachnospiraceae bacterium]|nr:hypothetical protein [Lachnospiraceae bacterium]
MVFKCKNCGGNTIYSPERHAMYCPYCDSQESQTREDASSAAMNICPNCGGSFEVPQHTSAMQCPYCDNYLIFNERVEGTYEPKLMIPFQMGKEVCKQAIRDKFKRFLFAPTDFLSEVKLNEMQGVYVPFWFYDYDLNCDFLAEGCKVRSWTSGNVQYTERSFYEIQRNLEIDFRKIPVDASIQMPDDVMDLMEPFGYDQLERFKPEYMSGFYAEKYNMTADLVESRAKQKMHDDAQVMLRDTYSGYSSVRELHNQMQVRHSAISYGLLPVWRYLYNYKDTIYPFYVNGQTGKIVGTAPLSKAKVLVYAGTLWASLTVLLAVLNGILQML